MTAPVPATFSVSAAGHGTLSYQWFKNGAAINGAILGTYTTPPTATGTNGSGYTVKVSDGSGTAISAAAILTVNPEPTLNLSPVGPALIGGQLRNQMVIAPASATFSVGAIGTAPITYQWSRNGLPIDGATSATYTTPPSTGADNGANFTVTVTNSVNGFTSSPATLTVISAPVAPIIVGQTGIAQVEQGNTASFRVFATGTAPLSYQWSKNGTPITDATDPIYTTPATTSADNNSQFTVTVTNTAGTITSGTATLAVISQAGGNEGFLPVYPGCNTLPENCNPNDLIGARYRFQVVVNVNQSHLSLISAWNALYTPGSTIQGYNVGAYVDNGGFTYTNGKCANVQSPDLFTVGQASLMFETTDYSYQAGQASEVGSAMNTSDVTNWPIQSYWADNITNLYQSRSESQFGINGIEALVTVTRGDTLTDISSFLRCGIPMLSTTYRMWTVTTQMSGLPTIVNQVVVPDASARYITPSQASQFNTEFQNSPGTFTVQFWDISFLRESDAEWHSVSTFETASSYLGNGQDFGIHVVSVNGQDRIEFSNAPGNSYLPNNLQFSIAPPSSSLASQTITFGALSNLTLGIAPFAITPSASSGLAVSVTSTTASVCTVSGNTVTIAAVGTCFLTASQAGNANYMAATPVTRFFTVNPAPSPLISSGGIVPADGTSGIIQPGEWVSIYGTNLATSTVTWNGEFPQSLGGASVTIDGKAAYLSYVSPGQINLQAPDDAALGPVPVTVTRASGTATSTVTLAQVAPSFLLLDNKHVAGIILRSDGSGAFGGGTYDVIGPAGSSLGYPTSAAKAGDIVELFGTGFGPTDSFVPAGLAFSGATPSIDPVGLLVNGVSVPPAWAGLSGAGLEQLNLIIPVGLGTGDVSLVATVGGVQTQAGIVISLK